MNKHTQELLRLAAERPDLEIIPSVDNELHNEDYPNSIGKIDSVDIEYYWVVKDDELFLSGDQIRDYIFNSFEFNEMYDNLSDEEFKKVVDAKYDELLKSGEIKEAIIIHIGLP